MLDHEKGCDDEDIIDRIIYIGVDLQSGEREHAAGLKGCIRER